MIDYETNFLSPKQTAQCRREAMTFSAAMDLIRRRRPLAQPIPAFVEMLEGLEQREQRQKRELKPNVLGPQQPTAPGKRSKEHAMGPHNETSRDTTELPADETTDSMTVDDQATKRRRIQGPSRE